MSKLNIIVPGMVTVVITVIGVLSAVWLSGLVPSGPWSELIKAGIVLFIIGSLLLIIAWSAYFTFALKQMLKKS